MLVIKKGLPLANLGFLEASNLAIKSCNSGCFKVYLDFSEICFLNHKRTREGFTKLESKKISTELSFSGWVGYFGYEFLASHLGLSLTANRDFDIVDGWFARPQTIIHILDNETRIESSLSNRAEEISKTLKFGNVHDLNKIISSCSSLNCNLSFDQYGTIFNQAKEAILDGESYQIKISQRYKAQANIDPLLAFAKLHLANPAPEAFLLKTENFSLVSCSPEIVIKKNCNHVITRPIGGTYERNPQEDRYSVIESFLSDQKEVAEHNMLVDLERNDLSTICVPGSVKLTRFREVETYAHLHHLVSTIEGRLKEGTTLSKIIFAMLPGGSITGCPKFRTMEWIDRLEPCFRGPYTGSFGLIEDNGNLSLNLIIRSMLINDGFCYTQSGGGIVINSIPEYEYKENNLKARALLNLLS